MAQAPDLLDKLVDVRHGGFIVLSPKLLAVQGHEVWLVRVDDLGRKHRTGWLKLRVPMAFIKFSFKS